MLKPRMLAIFCLGAVLPIASASSQETTHEPARRHDAVSPYGVSYATGAFQFSMPVVEIGQGEFPQKLPFVLSYNSGSGRAPAVDWANPYQLRWSVQQMDDASSGIYAGQKPNIIQSTWQYNIVAAHRSLAFAHVGIEKNIGPYYPATYGDGWLEWQAGSGSAHFLYTASDGTEVSFNPAGRYWLAPDGTKLSWSAAGAHQLITSNRGLAILIENPIAVTGGYTTRVCTFNLGSIWSGSITSCTQSTSVAELSFKETSGSGFSRITSVKTPDGKITSFTYGGRYGKLLTCVKRPDQAACEVTNTYDTCDAEWGGSPTWRDAGWNGSRDRVTQQVFAAGQTVTYAYTHHGTGGCRGNLSATMTETTPDGPANTIVSATGSAGLPAQIKDPLNRTTSLTYTGHNVDGDLIGEAKLIHTITSPENDYVEYTYDFDTGTTAPRGNRTKTRKVVKPGTVITADTPAEIVTLATFPTTCTYRRTCNKPTSVTDANGNVTNFTYDPAGAHGYVLTETGPAVNGISPVKRYEYVLRHARVKNSGGSFSQAATPVWLLLRERTCISTATTTSGCVGGVADEVVTEYEYGPDSTSAPNNLWVRGKVITTHVMVGTTPSPSILRTCFRYDWSGRKISETKPKGNTATCA